MAMIVIKFCPNCKASMGGGVDTRGIDIPFRICDSCGTYVIDKDNNEWELKTFIEKVLYVLIVTWSSILYSVLFPIITHIILPELSDDALLSIWLFGTLCTGIYFFHQLKQDIIDSNIRMQDSEYREILKKLNLLK